MDYVKAFTFIRDDKNWIGKLLIGGVMVLLGFLIIPTFFLYGYGIAITRNIMHGQDEPMPEWNDWGHLLTDGVLIWLIQLIWAIPFVIVGSLTMVPVIGTAIAADNSVNDLSGLVAGASLLSLCLMFALAILALLLIPPATILFARDRTFGAAFNIQEIITIIREHWQQIIGSMIALILAALVFSVIFGLTLITICIPIILAFVGPVWLQFGQSHLYGQIGALYEGSAYAGKFDE
ncbi:MAG: DUF4013 domain-containing protein [Anaerolineae bacterium]|nr:DUF4013 domain-containing protein [Anaerolineae bacterium]MCO5204032.1 DUF4013 domain-containing protein [Anaerolineae bacterium]